MRGVADWLVRHRAALVLITFVVVLAGMITVAGEDGGSSIWPAVLFGGLVAIALASVIVSLSGHDADAAGLAGELVATAAAQGLVERWLKRSRYYRFVGGAVGFVIGIGFVNNGQLHFVALGLLAGVAGGGALAEIHVLHRKRPASRTAGLSTRRLGDYAQRSDLMGLGLSIVASVVLVGVSGLLAAADRAAAVPWAVAASLVAVAALVLQRLLVLRTRPALRPELRDADDLLRHLAATKGFVRPALALGTALLAQSVNALGTSDGGEAASLVLWLIAIWAYRSSRLDADRLLPIETEAT